MEKIRKDIRGADHVRCLGDKGGETVKHWLKDAAVGAARQKV